MPAYGRYIIRLKYGQKHSNDSNEVKRISADRRSSGHFLPIGAESGVNLAQGKISPEQFASQVLQMPIDAVSMDQSKGIR